MTIAVLPLLMLLLSAEQLRAGSVERDTLSVYFHKGESRIDTSLSSNREVLDNIIGIVSRYGRGASFRITVSGYASPEGESRFNDRLSLDRSLSLLKYVEEHAAVPLPHASVRNAGYGVDWSGFEALIVSGKSFQDRDAVLHIVRNTPLWYSENGRIVGGRKKSLMDLRGGRTFNYMMDNIFPQLRRAEVILEYSILAPVESVPVIVSDITFYKSFQSPRPLPERIPYYRLALKTNLLADLILMPSLEMEYLINPEWSVAAHGAVAWWSIRPQHRYYQIATIYPEARWWFSTREPWHGHYLGLFAGGTWYDLENGGRGYKGEGGFVGLSYGYMMPVGKRLSMEFGIGLGYLYTEYEEYVPLPYMGGTHYVYQQTSQMHYLGPLKAKVALVWRFGDWGHYDNKKGGVR